MRPILETIIIIVFFGILSLSCIASLFGWQGEKLGGVSLAEKTKFDWKHFLNGTAQESIEQRIRRTSALFPYLVRTDNQINYSMFRQFGTGRNVKIILGKGGHIIERGYLHGANRTVKYREEKLRQVVERLATLQRVLTSHGVYFLLVVTPNKPEYLAEIVPSRYRVPGWESRPSLYSRFMTLAREAGVTVFDVPEFLTARGLHARAFVATGTHWSEYACCEATAEIIRLLSKGLGKQLTSFTCDLSPVLSTPVSFDRDLLSMTNLWFSDRLVPQVARVAQQRVQPITPYRPDVAIEGTSFVWQVLHNFDAHKVMRKRDFYYYFRKRHPYPKGAPQRVNREAFDVSKEIFNRDALIVEINTAFLHKVGHGLPERIVSSPAGALSAVTP